LALTFGGFGVLLGLIGAGLAVMALRSSRGTAAPVRLDGEPV
jgi:hypothetical protein